MEFVDMQEVSQLWGMEHGAWRRNFEFGIANFGFGNEEIRELVNSFNSPVRHRPVEADSGEAGGLKSFRSWSWNYIQVSIMVWSFAP
jgi:hypothetical protein